MQSALEYCLFNFRWIFVCLFLLPCTILYDCFTFVQKTICKFTKKKKLECHQVKAKLVQDQVKRWNQSDQTAAMCTGRPGWQAMTLREPKYKSTMYNIHINMNEILEINIEKRIIRVEPLVTIGEITAQLAHLNWTLPLVVELEDLTVGGLIMGTGVESSSHGVGFFQNICLSFELVLADGSLVGCSKDKDPDLFYSIPWSYGTVGFLTAVELEIIPSKRYVKLKYEPFYSLDDGVQMCEAVSRDKVNNQFVEGILFNKDEGVIMTGNMVDDGTNVNTIGRWYKPWFYEHVSGFMEKGTSEECIPLRDYYHRHTKSIFWELKDIVPFGNHLLFRWLFGWAMPPKISFLKLTQTGVIKDLYDKHHVVQDLIVPIRHMKEALMFFDEEVKVYPVWLCPVLIFNEPGLVHSFSDKPEMYIDIGLYGTPSTLDYDSVETTKRMEHFTIQTQGYQMLYAGTFCSEAEFRQMFDHSLYDRMRGKLQCHKAFPNIYGKVNRSVRD